MTASTASPDDHGGTDYAKLLRDLMPKVLSSIPPSLRRKLLQADVRPECTAGLLRIMRGFQNMEPWVFRLAPPFVRLEVSDCVTGEAEPWSRREIGIVAFLCILVIVVATATYVDGFTNRDPKSKKTHSALFDLVTGFSATSNTRLLLRVADKAKPDQYALQFLHGMRFFGIVHIALGHCGSVMSDTWSGMLNLFTLSERWSFMIITAGFSSVDTFFFLSGFFLCFTITRQKRNGPIVFIIGIRNFYSVSVKDIIPHMWYLSTDFQLFVVSLVVLLILKRLMLQTLDEYYIRPYYHAVCYFGGCVTYLIIDDFRNARISKNLQRVGWYGTVACALFCVFVKFAWYTSPDPVPMGVKLLAAFFDRILWTLVLAWITLACSTGRGGVLSKLLSWNAYVPLSKLSFGVYLIHVPFLHLWFHSSRERRYWSVFNQMTLLFALLVWSFLLSYLAFLVCEAPTAALDKLVFTKLIGGRGNKQATNCSGETQPGNGHIDSSDVKKQKNVEECVMSRC
ncbi:hypothetical protein MTO96_019771 [Rhipicephalus appendiculatus]